MTAIKKILVLAALAVHAIGAQAFTVSVPSSFNGLTWGFSSNVAGQGDCSQLVLDATGDLSLGFGLGMHGFLNCTSGSFAVSGTAYFTVNGNMNMTLHTGAGVIVVCNSLPASTLSGSCSAFNGIGTFLGTGSISFIQ